jgi:uncharacterized membrane protein
MTRTRIVVLMVLVVAVPAAAAGSLLSSSRGPCFASGDTGYRITASRTADFTITIDNQAAQPDLRMQLVDDPAAADFVLIDDSDNANSCQSAAAIRTIHVDAGAREADLTIALSQRFTPGQYKIYAHAADFSARDAAALFAVIWQTAKKRHFAERN